MFSLDFNGNLLQLSYDESTPMADGPLDIDTVKNGDWYYDADTSLLSFAGINSSIGLDIKKMAIKGLNINLSRDM